jgi:hypothetical protein
MNVVVVRATGVAGIDDASTRADVTTVMTNNPRTRAPRRSIVPAPPGP